MTKASDLKLLKDVKSAIIQARRIPAARKLPRKASRVAIRTNNLASPAREYAKSLLDPWNCSCCIPDGAKGTGCFTVKQVGLLGTGAGGGACAALAVPNPDSAFFADTGSTSTTPTVSGNMAAALSQSVIDSTYVAYRPISLGIKGSYVGNTQTDGGVIVAASFSPDINPSYANGASLAQVVQAALEYEIFPLRNGAHMRWEPESMDDAQVWLQTGAGVVATSAKQGLPWLGLFVFGANAATPSILEYEVVINFEGQFKLQTFAAGGFKNESLSEAGWYEKAKNLIRGIPRFLPLIGSLAGGYARGGLSGLATEAVSQLMGNGTSYPRQLGKSMGMARPGVRLLTM
jgi:hypothetical protein